YKEQDANYWAKYYKGTQERDATGNMVDLGGSTVSNLADSLLAFGLGPGSNNLVGATYKVFGDIDVAQYPTLVPSIYAVNDIIDTSYLQDISKHMGTMATVPTTTSKAFEGKKMASVVSAKAWHINFATGQASFSSGAVDQLNKLRRD